MRLTKFEHACFTVEKDGQVLVVDPGDFTTDFVTPENVVAVVITHEHGDHLDVSKLQAIVDKNPNAVIVAHESITSQLTDFDTQAVATGEHVAVGNFELDFYGGEHAVIHPSIPNIANLGVMIDNTVFYPGDSFVLPETPVKILALPIGAPWLKISETIDYLLAVRPELAFPTHDAVLSSIGKSVPDNRIPSFAEKIGAKYQRLDGPIDI